MRLRIPRSRLPSVVGRAAAAAVVVALATVSAGEARADDCPPRHDPADCFCPWSSLDEVVVGTVVRPDDEGEYYLDIEEVFARDGAETHELGELLPLPGFSATTGRFMAYQAAHAPWPSVARVGSGDGHVERLPDARIDPRYCTADLPYAAVATALVADDCRTTLRTLATVPPRSPQCETSSCASGGDGGAASGLLALLAVACLAWRRAWVRPRGRRRS